MRQTLGQHIRAARVARKETLANVGRAAFVSNKTMSDYELDKYPPTEQTITLIAEYLHAPHLRLVALAQNPLPVIWTPWLDRIPRGHMDGLLKVVEESEEALDAARDGLRLLVNRPGAQYLDDEQRAELDAILEEMMDAYHAIGEAVAVLAETHDMDIDRINNRRAQKLWTKGYMTQPRRSRVTA